MFTTIDIHFDEGDSVVELTQDYNGLVIREATSYEPRLNLFLGTTPEEVQLNSRTLINALEGLKMRSLLESTKQKE